MPQERLGNDEVGKIQREQNASMLTTTQFLTSLGSLLSSTSSAGHGSVFLTQKPMPSSNSSPSSQILIRATNGASAKPKAKAGSKISKTKKPTTKPKIKLATVVETADLEGFYIQYADVCKKGMEGMRKRDKKKAKEKAKAAKKKKGGAA